MPNLTISLNDDLLKRARRYAQKNSISLNALIRNLLQKSTSNESEHWIDDCFMVMDKAGGSSKGKKWNREDLYT